MTTPSPSAENTSRGIMLIAASFVMFTGIDTLSKLMGADGYHPVQITWGRLLIQLVLLFPFIVRMGGTRALVTRHPVAQTIRGLVMLVAGISFVSGLQYLSLATMTSINFVSPFLITILSIFILGERVGYHRWVAIAIGFVGALIVIRPGGESFHPASFFALTAALCWAVGVVMTRLVQDTDHAVTTLFYTVTLGVVITSFFVSLFWQPLNLRALILLTGIGLFSTAGQMLMIAALRHAPPSVIAPFTYTQLLWATLFGFIIFGDFPDRYTWLGSAVIIASGLYVWHRERQLSAPKVPLR